MRSKSCHRCGGRMAEGFTLVTDSNGGHRSTHWVEGVAEKSIWGMKIKGRRKIPIATYRCERCSLVENYAEEAVSAT